MRRINSFAYWLEVAALGIVLGLIIQGARAWTEPTAAPPNGNIGAPINTEDNTQEKKGSLQIDRTLGVVGNALVSGSMGIGTIAPQAKLDVAGGVKIGDATVCDVNSAGTIRYNTGSLQYCDGTTWKSMGSGSPSTAQGGLYGQCIEQGSQGCQTAIVPAKCGWDANISPRGCNCPTGFDLVKTGEGGFVVDSMGNIDPNFLKFYSCMKK